MAYTATNDTLPMENEMLIVMSGITVLKGDKLFLNTDGCLSLL